LGKLEEGQWRFVLPEEFRHRDARQPERATSGRVVSRKDRMPPRHPKIKGKSLYGQGSKRTKSDKANDDKS